MDGTKIDADVWFSRGTNLTGPYRAVIHLFEHQYSEFIHFWYGVAEVACDNVKLLNCFSKQGGSSTMWVRQEYGRKGTAHVYSIKPNGTECTVVAFFGYSSLCVENAGPWSVDAEE